MNFRFLIPFFILLGSVQMADAAVIDRVLVIVNDGVITEREFITSMQERVREIRSSGQTPPSREELERDVMERLILDRIQLQFAEQWGITVTDNQVQRAIENIAARQNLSMIEFMQRVRQAGLDTDAYRSRIRDQVLIQRVVDREVRQRVTVSDREIDREVERIQAEQNQAEIEYDISHILLSMPDAADEAAIQALQQKARQIVDSIASGSSFASMARQFSDAPDASDGGALGYRKPSQLPELFAAALQDMQPGEVSEILRSESGFHLVHLNARRGGAQQLIEQWQVRHILLKLDNRDQDEAINELNHLRTRITSGEDFGELAKVHSEDVLTRVKGGELGWLGPGDTLPEFEETVRNLSENEISAPITTQFGVHLVQVLGHRMQDVSQDLLRVRAERQVRQRKSREAYDHWLARIREEAYVKFRVKPSR